MFRITLVEDEHYPVYSMEPELYEWNSNWQVEVTPDEFYTALIYENLRDEAQKYCFSFADRMTD